MTEPRTESLTPHAQLHAHDAYARIDFADGDHADFHWQWLRHECPLERHPTTNERTLAPSEVPADVRPERAHIEGDALLVEWRGAPPGRAASRYPLDWLREHAYARNRAVPPPPASLTDVTMALDAAGLLPTDWRARLAQHGVVVARSGRAADATAEHTERLITQLETSELRVLGTHFGRIEDLRTDNTTNTNTDQLGYTDAAIALHTDQPFLDHPPRFQLLHNIRAADTGGASILANADTAAHWLAANDAEAYATLTNTRLRFHRKQKAFERVVVSPLLTRLYDGTHLVRSSYFTLAPFDVPFERVDALYRALRRFDALLHTPQFLLRFTLAPGDLVLYDNHRMLHGRTSFRGERWVRGVYFVSIARVSGPEPLRSPVRDAGGP